MLETNVACRLLGLFFERERGGLGGVLTCHRKPRSFRECLSCQGILSAHTLPLSVRSSVGQGRNTFMGNFQLAPPPQKKINLKMTNRQLFVSKLRAILRFAWYSKHELTARFNFTRIFKWLMRQTVRAPEVSIFSFSLSFSKRIIKFMHS